MVSCSEVSPLEEVVEKGKEEVDGQVLQHACYTVEVYDESIDGNDTYVVDEVESEQDVPIVGIDDPVANVSDCDVNLEISIEAVEDPPMVDENVEIPIEAHVEDQECGDSF
ncbi:Hypothetical predicted protein [Olea europaea subsp. europaea]|uniref:Uncharacterized protein n=1 Tax=Olea europaea subsp. europaea TaxID=158383 RepID=A0A8S0R5B1_OLEEU|nr:Hypothetical predicted protein [Olea europaea subsp. europaea]